MILLVMSQMNDLTCDASNERYHLSLINNLPGNVTNE